MVRTQHFVLSILFLLLSICSFSQKQTWPNTLLWRISGKGLTTSSYLYGTMHLQDRRVFQLSDSVYRAIESTSGFAIEVNLQEFMDSVLQTAFMKAEKEIYSTEKVSLNKRKLGKTGEGLLKEFGLNEKDITKKDLKRIRDYRVNKYMQQGEMPTFLDAYLYGMAVRQNKWVGAVEDVSDQLGLLDEMGGEINPENLFVADSAFSLGFEKMIKMYGAQDLNAIDRFVNASYTPGFIDQLLINRNTKMAFRMDSLSHVRSMFFAVGAAHLPGNSGVIQLLRDKGYVVEPVFSKTTIKPEEYSARLNKLPWTEVVGKDSAYLVMMPGKPLDYNLFGEALQMKMFFDMTTMTFYLSGSSFIPQGTSSSPTDVLNRMSTKMGKLLSIKDVTTDGMHGKEGVLQIPEATYRVRVFIRDNQLYMFMVGSNKPKALQIPDTDQFFASFKASTVLEAKQDWQTFTSPEKAFTIQLPTKARANKIIDNSMPSSSAWQTATYDCIDMREGAYYLLQIREAKAGTYLQNDSVYLSGIKQQLREKIPIISLDSAGTVNGFPALFFQGKSKDGKAALQSLSVIRGNRIYQIVAASDGIEIQSAGKVFSSFKLLPYSVDTDTVRYIDGMKVSSSFPFKLVPPDTTANNIDSSFKYYLGYDANSSVSYQIFKNSFSPFYWMKNDTAFFNAKVEQYQTYADTVISHKWIKNNNLTGYEIAVQPKLGGRITLMQLFVSADTLYSLQAMVHPMYKNSISKSAFFNEFNLSKVVTPSIYESKAVALINALKTTDSAQLVQRRNDLKTVAFEATDKLLLEQALLADYADDTLYYYNRVRRTLADALVKYADTATIRLIKANYFSQATTKKYGQLDFLYLLSKIKTEASYQAIRDLTTDRLPATDAPWSLQYPVTDSIALTKILFPDWLKHLTDSTYYTIVSNIATQLVDSNLLSVNEIRPYKNLVLQAANHKPHINDLKDEGWDLLSLLKLVGYLNDKEGNALLRRYLSAKNMALKKEAVVALIKNNEFVASKELITIAKDKSLRIELYDDLKKLSKPHLFPQLYANQLSFAESNLYNSVNEEDYDDFTLQFVGKRNAVFKGKLQQFYLFKIGMLDGESEKRKYYLGAVGPYDTSSKQLITSANVSTYSYQDEFDAAQLERQLKAILEPYQ